MGCGLIAIFLVITKISILPKDVLCSLGVRRDQIMDGSRVFC